MDAGLEWVPYISTRTKAMRQSSSHSCRLDAELGAAPVAALGVVAREKIINKQGENRSRNSETMQHSIFSYLMISREREEAM